MSDTAILTLVLSLCAVFVLTFAISMTVIVKRHGMERRRDGRPSRQSAVTRNDSSVT